MKTSERGHAKALTILLVSIGLVLVPSLTKTVAAATSGPEVFVNPASTPAQTLGSTFSVEVRAVNMPQFNTYDIEVRSDPSVINATDLSAINSILNTTAGTPIELVHCVNGAGRGCVSQRGDGPGIVHSSFTVLGQNVNASGNGLLFTITYQALAASTSPIAIQNATTIVAISGHGISHATISGRYAIGADFDLSSNPESLILQKGASNQTTFVLTSVYNFDGTVDFTIVYSQALITASLSMNKTILLANGSNSTILTVTSSAQASATSFYIYIIAVSGSLSRTFTVPIIVNTNPDFQPGASPQDLLTHQSSGNSTTITVTSYNGFTGNVKLKVDAPDLTTAVFDQTNNSTATLNVPPNGSNRTTLRVTTQSSPSPFRDSFNLTATGGSITHMLVVVAEPPPPDFSVVATPSYASIHAGSSQSVTLNVTSLDYYWGSLYELGTTVSGLSFSFEHGNYTLNWSQTQSSTLRITSDALTPAGNYTMTLVVFGIGQLNGKSTRHTVQFTLKVSSTPIAPVSTAKTFLGLDEPEFFGLIITLAAALAVIGAFASRRPSGPQRRAILEG